MDELGNITKNNKDIDPKTGKQYELQINAIPNNMEKYMVFIDGQQFMASLDNLLRAI